MTLSSTVGAITSRPEISIDLTEQHLELCACALAQLALLNVPLESSQFLVGQCSFTAIAQEPCRIAACDFVGSQFQRSQFTSMQCLSCTGLPLMLVGTAAGTFLKRLNGNRFGNYIDPIVGGFLILLGFYLLWRI